MPSAKGTDFADFYRGQLLDLAVASGGNQTDKPNSILTEPLSVMVGDGLQNAPVTFTITEEEARLTTSRDGDATPTQTLDTRAISSGAGFAGEFRRAGLSSFAR